MYVSPNSVINILLAPHAIKPFNINDGFIEVESANIIENATVIFSGGHNGHMLKVSTEIQYHASFTGYVEGVIQLNDRGNLYKGTIIVKDTANNNIITTAVINNGEFRLDGLNPHLKYNIECIPFDVDLYQAKTLYDFTPSADPVPTSIHKSSESTEFGFQPYKAIYKVNCDVNASNINVVAMPGIGVSDLQLTKIKDHVYMVECKPTQKDISYEIIANVDGVQTTFTNTITLSNRTIDIKFGFINEDKLSNSIINTVGSPLTTTLSYGEGLISENGKYVTIKNDLLDIGNNAFDLLISFVINQTLSNGVVPLFSTTSTNTNVAGNLYCLLNSHGLKIVFPDGQAFNTTNNLNVDYNFKINTEYKINLIREKSIIKVFINDVLVYNDALFNSKYFNFISGGEMRLGYATNVDSQNYSITIGQFKFIKDGLLDKGTNISDIGNNILYGIQFNNGKIQDITGDIYHDTYTVDGNIAYKKQNTLLKLKNINGLSDIYTIEFKVTTSDTMTKQYILFNYNLKIYFENNKLIVVNLNDIHEFNVSSSLDSCVISIKKYYDTLKVYIDNTPHTVQLSAKFLSASFSETFLLSDNKNSHQYNSRIDYIIFDNNVYSGGGVGIILKSSPIFFDIAIDESIDKTHSRPINAVGNLTWTVINGILPIGLTLEPNGRIHGTATTEGNYIFKIQCVDEIGSKSYITYNVQIGTIVSYCDFDGENAATTMVDKTGRVWTSNSGAALNSTNKVFGKTSGFFNGAAHDWTTPSTDDINLGNDDWTISMWIYNTTGLAYTYRTLMSKRTTYGNTSMSYTLLRLPSSNIYAFEATNGAAAYTVAWGYGKSFEWEFITVSRKGGYLYTGQNGEVTKQHWGTQVFNSNVALSLGQGDTSNNMNFIGYIDEFKFIKNAALYTENFDPPKKPSNYKSNVIDAPYNVYPTYKNGNLTIKWDQNSYGCYYKVYVSETPLNPLNMPPAIVTTDTGVYSHTINNPAITKLYIRVEALKGGTWSTLSNEVSINIDQIVNMWTPEYLDNKDVWIDCADFDGIGLDYANRVQSIKDKSGQNHNIQATARTNQPVYDFENKCITAIGDTYCSLEADFNVSSINIPADYYLIAAVKPKRSSTNVQAQSSTGAAYWNADTNNNSHIFQVYHPYGEQNSVWVMPYFSVTTNCIAMSELKNSLAPYNISRTHTVGSNKMIAAFSKDFSDRRLKSGINGIYVDGSFPALNQVSASRFRIFGRYSGGQPNSDIHELIFARTHINDTELKLVEGYLAHKWGLVDSLPVDHPYKLDFPRLSNVKPVMNIKAKYNTKYNEINISWDDTLNDNV